MHLGISKSKNSTSLYVLKSTYQNGLHSTKIVEKLGTTEEIEKRLNGRDPIEWAKEYIDELNRLEKSETREIVEKYNRTKIIKKNTQRTFNGGYLFLQQIYNSLGLPKLCKDIRRKYDAPIDFDAIFSSLLYTRILYPSSKYTFQEGCNQFISQPNFSEDDVHQAMLILSKEYRHIQNFLYRATRAKFGANTNKLYVDKTVTLYESSALQEDNIPVIPLEIYFDGNMIPLTYRINPYHLEKLHENRIQKVAKEAFDGSDSLTFCDYNSSEIQYTARSGWNVNNKYISEVPLSNLTYAQREYLEEDRGWSCNTKEGTFRLSLVKKNYDPRDEKTYYYKDVTVTENHEPRRYIFMYSTHHYEVTRLQKQAALYRSFDQIATKQGINDITARSDGFKVFKTDDMTISAEDIIYNAKMRNGVHNLFRILQMETPPDKYEMSELDMMRSHYIICFVSLVLVHCFFLQYELGKDSYDALNLLREMNIMRIPHEGYVPLFERTDLTDKIHEHSTFRLDYQIITEKQIDRILRSTNLQ